MEESMLCGDFFSITASREDGSSWAIVLSFDGSMGKVAVGMDYREDKDGAADMSIGALLSPRAARELAAWLVAFAATAENAGKAAS
jgi:hypothetical protein